MVFYISAAIYVFGTVVFVAFSDGNLQTWAAEQTSLGVLEPDETLELKDIRAADSSEGQSNKC